MNKTNDGGPAFPGLRRHVSDNCFEPISEGGMTLRDWFAGQALTGLIAGCVQRAQKDSGGALLISDSIASTAYDAADAMLAAREGGAK